MTAVAAAAVVIPGGGVARAAPPVFVDPPTRVYTSPGVDLPFAGDDPITQQSKKIDVTFNGPTDNTCDVIDQDEHSGNCAFAQIRILEAGRGAMTIDDSGIAYTSGTQSGDNTFNIAGTFADIKSALESLVYVPPDDEFETTDITPVTLEVSVQAPQPVPDAAAVQVDIRVEGANDPPNLTAPGDDPYQVNINETFSVAESAGTEVFEVTDEDAQQQDNLPPDYLLGVAWLDCGTMTFVKPNQSPGLVAYEGTVEDMLAQLAADYQAIAADPSIVIGQIGQNVSIGTGWANVVAVGWLASIDADNDDFTDNFNEILSAIDFHAPAMPATCTLTIFVSDLGNNGMPLLGEVPDFAFDLDSVVFNVVDPDAPPTDPESTPPTDPESTPPTDPESTPPTDPESTPPTDPESTPPTDPESTPPDNPTGRPRRDLALQAVVTVACGNVEGTFQAQIHVTNPTPYRFEGGASESLDPGASFDLGTSFPEPSGQFGVNGFFDVDGDGAQGPGDVPVAATWPAVAPTDCDTTTTEAEPPDDLPTPPDPSLVVTVQTECVDDGASYLATFASTNPSPYTFYGLWVIPPGGTAYNVQSFIAPFSVTLSGYFDLDGSGTMTPPEFITSQSVAVDVPEDCTTETTPPDPDDPSLQVTIATRCADPGTEPPYLLDLTVTNGPTSPWRGSYSTGLATEDAYLTNSESDSETLPYGPMATLVVDGYFDVNTNGVQDAGDIDYSSITPLAVPDDCPPTSTEPVDSSEPPSSDPTTTSTTTTTIPLCSDVAELATTSPPRPTAPPTVPPTVAQTPPPTPPPTPQPTVPATDPTTTASTTTTSPVVGPIRTTAVPRVTVPVIPIRTTTTLRLVTPPRITIRPPGLQSMGGGERRAIGGGGGAPAVGACVDSSGTLLPATGSSMVPELIVLASLLTLSGGALVAIRRRVAP